MTDKELKALAMNYIWIDYVNAQTEYEEVEALVALLKKVYEAGKKAA